MRIGLALPHYPFSFPDGGSVSVERVVGYARRAEDLGFDSVWISDHLFLDLTRYGGPPGRHWSPEALTLMTSVAAATNRLRVGSLVLCAAFRNPAVLAQAARTLHETSGGRIELGMGAGWNQEEFAEAGIEFGTAGDRIRRLAVTVAALKRAMPDGPPVWIGGKGGPKILRLVAEHAAGWNIVWNVTPAHYRTLIDGLEQACSEIGRDPTSVRRSVGQPVLLCEDREDLEKRFEAMQHWAPGGLLDGIGLDAWGADRLAGTPEECAERIAAFGSLGVEEIILSPAPLPFAIWDDEQLELIGRRLLPLVR